MKKIRFYKNLYGGYLRIGLLTATQYPMDTFLMIISLIIREAATFLGVVAIANVAGGIGGWGLYDVCLLFAMGAMIEALGQAFLDMIWSIGHMCIRKGQMDVFFIRPAPIFLQLVGQRIHLQAIISFLTAFGIMVFSLVKLQVPSSITTVLFIIEFIICGTIINSSVYLFFNSLNFWIVQGNDIAVLVQTMREFAKYPIHIFPVVIKGFFTFIIPFGFIGYYPAAYLMGRTDLFVPGVLPIVALVVVWVGGKTWSRGVSIYDSTGT